VNPRLSNGATIDDHDLAVHKTFSLTHHERSVFGQLFGTAEATGSRDRVIVISFDHVVLKQATERHPALKTEAITHARHADLVGVLRACGARSASIELDMFRPDAGQALHDAGLSNRVHVPRPEQLVEYWRGGRDPLPSLVQFVSDGLIDSISGDDVPFIARLVARAGKAGA